MPLVGYFTGARTNEIAQLDTSDIREIDGHPYFDFCADEPKATEAKRIKTNKARQVPIHPRLVELGFLAYVDSQKRARQKKLFGDGLTYLRPRNNETKHNKEGGAKSAGNFFNESPKGYLVTIGVHSRTMEKPLLFSTYARNKSPQRQTRWPTCGSIIDAITGRAPNSIASKHYDGGATIEHKLSAILHLPLPAAVMRLGSYQSDFVDRFKGALTRSIASHHKKHPRTI